MLGRLLGKTVGNLLGDWAFFGESPDPDPSVPGCGSLEEHEITSGTLTESCGGCSMGCEEGVPILAYDYGRKVRFEHTFKTLVDGVLVTTDPSTITINVKIGSGSVTPYVYGTDAEVVKSSTGVYYIDLWLTTGDTDWIVQFVGTGACEYVRTRKFHVRENLLAA